MNAKKKKTTAFVKVSESELLSLVAAKLKDRDLFPEKTKTARQFLKKTKSAKK